MLLGITVGGVLSLVVGCVATYAVRHIASGVLICRVFGHRWVETGPLYNQGKVWATVGYDPDPQQVNCTWGCDETCGRCGGETWWPS